MLHITSLDDGIEIFKALGSDVRIQILNILLENSNMSMKDLAARLNITNGALTGHIKKLESCGLITTSAESVVHGNQKICSVHWDRIIIDLEKQVEDENVYNTEVKIGHYSNYDITPTCLRHEGLTPTRQSEALPHKNPASTTVQKFATFQEWFPS